MVEKNIDSKLFDLIAPESIAYWSLLGIEVESAVQGDIRLGLSMRPELGTRLPEIIHGGAIRSLIAAAAGGALSRIQTTVLMTAEEGLEAIKGAGNIEYRPPST